jgi:hypothetical protein
VSGEELFFIEEEGIAGEGSFVLLDPLVGVEPELIFWEGLRKLDEVIDELAVELFEALEVIFGEVKRDHFSGVGFERCV